MSIDNLKLTESSLITSLPEISDDKELLKTRLFRFLETGLREVDSSLNGRSLKHLSGLSNHVDIDGLVRMLEKCDTVELRFEMMIIFLNNLSDGTKAIEVLNRLKWREEDLAEFFKIMIGKDNAFKYKIDDYKAYLYKIESSELRFEMLKPLLSDSFHFHNRKKCMEFLSDLRWEQKEIIEFSHVFFKRHITYTLTGFEDELLQILRMVESPIDRLELIKKICLSIQYSTKSDFEKFWQLFSSFEWEESNKISLFNYIKDLKRGSTNDFLSSHFMMFNIQDPAVKFEIAKFLNDHSRERTIDILHKLNVTDEKLKVDIIKVFSEKHGHDVITDFEYYAIHDETDRTEIVKILACKHPAITIKTFSKYEIHEDKNKAQILIALFNHLTSILSIDSIRFSDQAYELSVYRQIAGTMKDPLDYLKYARTSDNPVFHQPFIEFIGYKLFGNDEFADSFLRICHQIKNDYDKLRALKWLEETLYKIFHANYKTEIFPRIEIAKTLSALMMLRRPELRDLMTSDYLEFLFDENAHSRCIKRHKHHFAIEFNSMVCQPIRTVMRNSTSPPDDIKSFFKYIGRMRNEGVRLLQVPDTFLITRFTPEEQKNIANIFQNYIAYGKLHSPENFDSQLLNPILKVIENYPLEKKFKIELIESFKTSLCTYIESDSAFSTRLNELPIPLSLKCRIYEFFVDYKDAPKKYHFEFINIYCDLLRSSGADEGTIERFAHHVSHSFDRYYFPLLQVLQGLYKFKADSQTVNTILDKLGRLFSSNAGNPVVASELSSLTTIFLMAKNHSSILTQALQTDTFTDMASAVIAETLRISSDQRMFDKFTECFMHPRLKGLFLLYVANLVELKDEWVMSALGRAVQSILEGTYEKDRYSTEYDLHLHKIKVNYPDIYKKWTELNLCSSFTLSGDPGDEPVFTVQTSTDYLDIFLCGNEVLGSCQELDGWGHHSKCILGYLSGKFILLVVKDKDNKIVSRAFLILNFNEKYTPVLYLEKFYTRNLHPLMVKKIEEQALAIAHELDLPLIAKEHLKNQTPATTYTRGAIYGGGIVSIGNSWSPYEYSDSYQNENGSITNGIYDFREDMYGALRYLRNV